MRHTERQRRIQYVYMCRDMALHESKFEGRSTNATAVRYHTSPILLFSISSCISPFFFLIRMWLRIHTVSFHSQRIFLFHTRHACINTTRLTWFLYSDEACRATLLSIIHECQRICTYLKFELQPMTSLQIYNFVYAHYMLEFIVTNIHDTQDHTRMYVHVRIYACTYIYISFRLIPHFM